MSTPWPRRRRRCAPAARWIPLRAPLQSARVAHTLELVWAAFWLGALMLAIEVAQRWSPAHLADITPVLIPAIWWLVWRRWPP